MESRHSFLPVIPTLPNLPLWKGIVYASFSSYKGLGIVVESWLLKEQPISPFVRLYFDEDNNDDNPKLYAIHVPSLLCWLIYLFMLLDSLSRWRSCKSGRKELLEFTLHNTGINTNIDDYTVCIIFFDFYFKQVWSLHYKFGLLSFNIILSWHLTHVKFLSFQHHCMQFCQERKKTMVVAFMILQPCCCYCYCFPQLAAW